MRIREVRRINYDTPVIVYDLTVSNPYDEHNFMVEGGIFIHNCCFKSCHASVLCDGSKTVQVNGRLAGRVGDPVCCGSRVMTGSADVICGG